MIFKPKDPFLLRSDTPILITYLISAIIFLALFVSGCRTVPMATHKERMIMVNNQIEDIKKSKSAYIMQIRLEWLQSELRKFINDF